MQRWLQVDPKAEATYGLTPYGAMNQNPISYADPEGDVAWLAPLAISMIKGAAIGVAANGIMNITNQQNFFAGAGNAALWGAIGGGVAHGIGAGAQALANAGANKVQVGLAQAGAHGFSGGIQSWAQGGNFGSGFLSGGVSSGIGSATSSWSSEAQMVSGIAGGGLASIAGGGSFWDGAKMGAITMGLNHLSHELKGLFQGSGIPPELKGFPGAEYQGTTKNGRHAWIWKGKWLEWTNKSGGVIEMYDNKTKKTHYGKYDPNTGVQLKKGIKTRVADVLKFGLNRIRMTFFYFEPGVQFMIEPYPVNHKVELH
mgnify:CR=1 FL=1